MNPIGAVSVCAVGLAVLLGTMFVLPKPKPEPPPIVCDAKQPQQECKPAQPVEQITPAILERPVDEKSNAERVRDLERKTEAINREQQALIGQIKQLTKDAKAQ